MVFVPLGPNEDEKLTDVEKVKLLREKNEKLKVLPIVALALTLAAM